MHDENFSIKPSDTSKDPFLTRAIAECSQAIINYANNPFFVETISDQVFIQQDPYPYQTPGGVWPLKLSRWPLANLALLPVASPGAPAGATAIPLASTAGLIDGKAVSAPGIPAGTTLLSFVPNTSATLSAPLTAPLAVGAIIGFGISVVQTIATARDATR